MPFINIYIPHNCPYCKSENHILTFYQMSPDVPIKGPGEPILAYHKHALYIVTRGYCEHCKKDYKAKIGIKKGRLTDLVDTIKNG